MSVKQYNIKQGDRRPYLYLQLGRINADKSFTPQDLTGATVTFSMKTAEGELVIDEGAAVVDDALTGQVHYAWQPDDTATPGEYVGEFQALYGSEPETFPNDKLGFKIVITPQIA